jgi:FlaA1/EpsC-like NDP-sugar epimerase
MSFDHASAYITRARRLAVDTFLSTLAFLTVTTLPFLLQDVSASPSINEAIGFIVLYALIASLSLALSHTYTMIWRYVSFRDLMHLILATTLTVFVFYFVMAIKVPQLVTAPFALVVWTIALVWTANLGFLALPRFLMRAADEMHLFSKKGPQKYGRGPQAVLVTGEIGRVETFIRGITRMEFPRYNIVGVLSDNIRLHNSYLNGVQVMGSITDLGNILAQLETRGIAVRTLVLAKDDATPADFETLMEVATPFGIKVGRLPPSGTLHDFSQLQPIELADLLGRPEVKVNTSAVRTMVKDRCILVTGAGGSIGSELCRQIARLEPSKLVLLDNGEFNLYSIDLEIGQTYPDLVRESALVDIRDRAQVQRLVAEIKPDIVFHAAALKHVPLLEDHPIEAVKTNVLGTANVAEACQQEHVATMVTISTDKAVNPCNVMGATKKLAESYCQALDQANHVSPSTRFITVRFGNVLGSNGSVVPLFRRQIEEGGPITVTHPEMVRYFMTIPEAVTLVLQAGVQGIGSDEERGSINVLEMGKPVKIVDLARQMIRLSGLRPDIDIPIKFTGLRPGEKLYEEVAYGDEEVLPTGNKSILRLAPRTTNLKIIQQQIQELQAACARGDTERLMRLVRLSVPDYHKAVTVVAQKEVS